MSQSTLNNVVQSVADMLTARFPELPVHTERGSDSLPVPCIFVQLLKSEQTRELNRRFKRTYSLDVQFFPPVERGRYSANEVAEQFYELFAVTSADDGLMPGAGIHTEWKDDGTLHLYLTFSHFVWVPAGEVVKMRTLRQEGMVKHGD
ncbi:MULTISPECIES: phage tail terminator family protein [Paenibacillus]|uniref:phage tail terminator family protein n=1 Tax=Paenibacillus TaxID=44249 RepID=UPI002FE2ECF4